jgi:hypothetical protein
VTTAGAEAAAGEPGPRQTTPRSLVFVNDVDDADPPAPDTDVVVLDSAWTPSAGGRPDLRPVREILWDIISRVNVHDESLAALDRWAAEAGLPGRLMVNGTSWWFHARSFLRLDLHELLLWHHVLEVVAPLGRYRRIVVPVDRPRLLEVAELRRTLDPDLEVADAAGTTSARRFGSGKPSDAARGASSHRWRGLAWRAFRYVRRNLRPRAVARGFLFRARLRRVVKTPPDVLAIVRSSSFHVVGEGPGTLRADPYVRPVLERLRERGITVASVILGVSHSVEPLDSLDDPALLPLSIVRTGFMSPVERIGDEVDFSRRIAGVEAIPLRVDGIDLAPALVGILAGLGPWFTREQRDREAATRLVGALKPRALITGWEGARTGWLAAARACGVPSVAIQHGVIYRNNPDYYRPVVDGLLRPDLTCLFGAYERDLLVDECGYAPTAVIATGSPRIAEGRADQPMTPTERADVRRQLGVAGGDRMLVISAARHTVGEELHSMPVFGRLFDGPLPGVHLVVKLHPEESRGDHYAELIDGLARAGGWPAPRLTIVRDVDVYQLLRSADAHLGIYSTVLTDAVLAGTPNMIAVGQAWADLLGYVPAGVAVPVQSNADVRSFMANPPPLDAAARERFLRRHFEPGDAASRIATAVMEIGRRAHTSSGAGR